jgi:hypothetical protein
MTSIKTYRRDDGDIYEAVCDSVMDKVLSADKRFTLAGNLWNTPEESPQTEQALTVEEGLLPAAPVKKRRANKKRDIN